MSVQLLRADTRALPLATGSVDLIVTSPPYWAQRAYQDDGQAYDGQIGAEPTPAEYIANMLDATREWARVLKPGGSMFVNLGDKYGRDAGVDRQQRGTDGDLAGRAAPRQVQKLAAGTREKSLIGLPWRYALGCIDELGLILRAEIIWAKPNGMPESCRDRVRRNHEQWFHLTKQPAYYSAVDRIRRRHSTAALADHRGRHLRGYVGAASQEGVAGHVLGSLPPSVWDVLTEPLTVPEHVGADHYAAFPLEWPLQLITGFSPAGVCTKCGHGRAPAVDYTPEYAAQRGPGSDWNAKIRSPDGGYLAEVGNQRPAPPKLAARVLLGEVCACTPYITHPGTGEPYAGRLTPPGGNRGVNADSETLPGRVGGWMPVGPWREYLFDEWQPADTTPGVVLDPFGGTGTTALAADVLGRHGISVDMSATYGRIAQWRTTDPGQRAAAMRVARPAREVDGQDDLLKLLDDMPASDTSMLDPNRRWQFTPAAPVDEWPDDLLSLLGP
jgi:DNA modification methylase